MLMRRMISSRKEEKSGWIEDAADLAARVVFLVLPVTLAFNGVIGGLGVVKGCSMQPTLNPDLLRDDLFSDRIILDRWSVHSNKISRGDVVVLRYGSVRSLSFLKIHVTHQSIQVSR